MTRPPHGEQTTVHWGEDLRPLTATPAEGFSAQEWFTAASLDTGTSHVKVGRTYVVASEHSKDIFIASSHAEAMSMLRDFEEQMCRESSVQRAARRNAA